MEFWWFILGVAVFVPAVMAGFGLKFFLKAPEEVGFPIGFNTKRSVRNEETWKYAHRTLGKIWTVLGGIMIPVTAAAMYTARGKDMDTVGSTGAVMIVISAALMACGYALTEYLLKKKFG
ncbi:MAG: SdpI family protein [Erysipelotrichales bacterium]|nr:SdpI family protein [Erysipelotrichales bacterium]